MEPPSTVIMSFSMVVMDSVPPFLSITLVVPIILITRKGTETVLYSVLSSVFSL